MKLQRNSYLVLTPAGEPAAEATVAICTPELGPTIKDGIVADYSPCERAVSGADGRVSISPQTGLFGLMVVHGSGAKYAAPGQLATSRTITLEPWARVEGTLRMHNQLAANEHVTLSLDEAYAANMPRVHFDYKTPTDANGKFAFERVVPGNGHVVRAAVSQLSGGMTRWTPTHVTNAKFLPGETTQVELGQPGRQIVGRLALPADITAGNDWRLAMASLQSRPKNVLARPEVPFPLGMDPQKDQDAARIWWEQWRFTDEGKEFQQQMKRYQDAINGFKPNHFSGRVEPDGSFAFEDIPGGDYQFSVQAFAASPKHPGMSGDMIATLQHTFAVPDVDDGAASEPVDLGELTLVTFQQRNLQP